MTRSQKIKNFLKNAGWGNATITALAGDASFRRYDRISLNGLNAVLMDAPPQFEDIRPFIAIANHLRDCHLNAPEILSQDVENGFLLLEDLGDDLFKIVLDNEPQQEKKLYNKAVDELLKLNSYSIPSSLSFGAGQYQIPHYEMDMLISEVSLFCDWYYPALTGGRLPKEKRGQFIKIWKILLKNISLAKECLVLHDYHAENLLDIGDGKVGQLDFQDAVVGHSAYDLVSLLQDARRDVSPQLEQELIAYFAHKLTKDLSEFKRDYAILGAQRNLKIIGIFARLYLRDGKDNYLKLMPRMWKLVERCLEHPALSDLKIWLDNESAILRHVPLKPHPLKPANAMILAAGLGVRMRPLTNNMPKPMIKIAGKEMLGHSLDALSAAGVGNAIINIHHFSDQISYFVKMRKDRRTKIAFSDERQQLLDSGGGVKKALPFLGSDPFYIINCDMIWTDHQQLTLGRLAVAWQNHMDILMLLIHRDKANGYDDVGDFHMDDDGCLTPRGDDNEADYIYSGILIIRPECFKDTPTGAFSLKKIFKKVSSAGKMYGIVHNAMWYHVGTPDAVLKTEQLLKGE